MRLNEILIEQQLDEKPQGMLSRLGNKLKSFVPGSTGDKAKGNLEVGKEANWLKKQFDIYLGKVGKDPSPQLVIDFLRKNNYPTGDAEQEMTKVTKGQKIGAAAGGAAKGAVDAVKGAVGGVAKGVSAVGKGIADVAKGAVAGAKDANADPNAQKTAQDNTQAPPNAQKTAQDNTQAPADKQNPAQKQPAGNPDNNLAIKGQKKKIVPPSEQNKQVVNQSIDWSEAEFIFEDAAAVSLSGGQLDNIFMAAVRQAIARDEGGQADTGTGVAPADAQQGGLKGAAQAAAGQFADAGSTLPPEIKKQLETLPARDKQQLLKML